MADNSNCVFYANGNLPVHEFMNPEILSDPAFYPYQATLETVYAKGAWMSKAHRVGNWIVAHPTDLRTEIDLLGRFSGLLCAVVGLASL